MTTTSVGKPVIGASDGSTGTWTAAAAFEPASGIRSVGESILIRSDSTSGTHRAGVTRTRAGSADPSTDGVVEFRSAAPDGDETLVVLEGAATVTAVASRHVHDVGPGSVLFLPKGVETAWRIDDPAFRTFWSLWDSPTPAVPEHDITVRHVDDDQPGAWERYAWEDEDGVSWSCGENLVMRSTGSTGMLKTGIWRNGPAPLDGSGDDPQPAAGRACSGPVCAGHRVSSARGVGDESMILLSGSAHIVNHDSGEEFDVHAGDVVAQYMGPDVSWTSTSAYVKKLFVQTNAVVPA